MKSKSVKKSKFLSFFLIFFFCCLIGISVGLAFYYNIFSYDVVKEVTLNTTSIVINYLSSEQFVKLLPTLQAIVTTIAASLGIIATIRNLRKKD